ncbi:MAG: AMP-binding protein [Treponemataceae bacterium]|nr:AMP-binding protein [Treponemataceae bacterium]
METIKDLGKYTFPCLLANSVKKFGKRPALALVGQKEFTYSEVKAKSEEVSKMLLSFGLKRNDKVAIFAGGRPEWGIAYFGVVNQGMIAVPLLQDFSKVEVESIMKHCGDVKAIFIEERLYEKMKDLESVFPPVIIKIEDYSIIKGEKTCEVETLPEVEINEEDTASLIYTSGTTGRSKGVELTHKNLVWSCMSGQYVHRVNKFDKCLSFMPISHVYEFSIGFSMQMLNGSCVYYLGKPPVVSALLPAFKIVQPTIVLSVPLVIEKIYKSKVLPTFQKTEKMKKIYSKPLFRKLLNRIAGKKLIKTFGGKLNFFGIGGSKVDPNVEVFMREAKFPYAIGYGLTETSPLIAGSGPEITVPDTLGPVLPELDVRIANPNEKGVGEIVVKGPNVMKGYYKDPDLTSQAFTTDEDSCGAGYFKTGDLGDFEKIKGRVRLCLKGRCKNMILGPNGENIYPEDLEFVLNQHPVVSESLVVEGKKGLVAIIQLDLDKIKALYRGIEYNQAKLLNEIQFFVNSKMNRNSQVQEMQVVDEFEKTASKKIKRYVYDLKNFVQEKIAEKQSEKTEKKSDEQK